MKSGTLRNQQQVDKFCSTWATGRQAISDAKIRGLQLERMESGQARWRLRYLSKDGRGRSCITLGDAKIIGLSDARELAEKELLNIAMGNDPKQAKLITKSIPTFSTFIEEQYLPYVKSYKRSWTSDVSLLKNHLLPRFGSKYLDEITRQDIVKMHYERKASGAAAGSANRLLIMMRFIFNLAVRWELPGIKVNPTKGVPLMEENNKKERYLSVEEAQRLYTAVCASENPMLQYIVPMLILTGARKREVLDAKWQDFDFLRRIWRIPTTKTGKARHVPLSDGVISLLSAMPREAKCEWTFPNPDTGKPYVSIFWAWDSARNKADLADVRIHDLRHSHASFLVNAGRTLYEVQHILGHTQVKTTQRYAHLSHDTLLDATNSVNTALGGMFMPMVSASPAAQVQLVQ
jgi:integrase